MSRVQLALNVGRPRRLDRLLHQAVPDPAGQGPRRLRQLRDRRSAAEARAVRRRGRARLAQPRRGRGRVDRRGRWPRSPGWQATGSTSNVQENVVAVASRCRTRPGCTGPENAVGVLHGPRRRRWRWRATHAGRPERSCAVPTGLRHDVSSILLLTPWSTSDSPTSRDRHRGAPPRPRPPARRRSARHRLPRRSP